jgi:hypothetical protein
MAAWPFGKPRAFLTAEDESWQVETWCWLLARLGKERLSHAPLVTPTDTFFPPSGASDHDRAISVFDQVRKLTGLSNFPCTLVAQPERNKLLGVPSEASARMTLGTFSTSETGVAITYDPALTTDPIALIYTFAHELSHYVLHGLTDGIQDKDVHEYTTDLTTVFLGFGLFGANRSYNFHRDLPRGWSTSSMGYLDQRNWCFALAVFCALRNKNIAELKPWLKPYLYSDVQAAARNLRRAPEITTKIVNLCATGAAY